MCLTLKAKTGVYFVTNSDKGIAIIFLQNRRKTAYVPAITINTDISHLYTSYFSIHQPHHMTYRNTRQKHTHPLSISRKIFKNTMIRRKDIVGTPGLRTLLLKKRFHTNFKRFLTHIDSIAQMFTVPRIPTIFTAKAPVVYMRKNSTTIAHFHFSKNTTISLFLENTVFDKNYSIHRLHLLPNQYIYILYNNIAGTIITLLDPIPELICKATVAETQISLL